MSGKAGAGAAGAFQFYDPFKDFRFEEDVCFLSGQRLDIEKGEKSTVQVFPQWLMDRFNMSGQPFKMLDESFATYGELKLPASNEVASRFAELEAKMQTAFEGGHAVLKGVDQLTLFQWIAKIVYGVIHCEIRTGIRQHTFTGESLNFSQVLAHKFKNLHAMMQSLIRPVEFEGVLPFKIMVYPVQNPPEHFGYRDEINTLVFSMRLYDFGIIACLQDNGVNSIYHEETQKLVAGHTLHPVQFEELCGLFFYSAYLLNRLPEYTYLNAPGTTYIEAMPLSQMSLKPLFDPWQAKTYGQVLENFWKPWEFTLFEIIKDPENPMSFLREPSEPSKFHLFEQIDLPLA